MVGIDARQCGACTRTDEAEPVGELNGRAQRELKMDNKPLRGFAAALLALSLAANAILGALCLVSGRAADVPPPATRVEPSASTWWLHPSAGGPNKGIEAQIAIVEMINGETVRAAVPIKVPIHLAGCRVLPGHENEAQMYLRDAGKCRFWCPMTTTEFLKAIQDPAAKPIEGELWCDGDQLSLSQQLIRFGFAELRRVPGSSDYGLRDSHGYWSTGQRPTQRPTTGFPSR
jgi:hypothetical protein